jgi:hypothetical protein
MFGKNNESFEILAKNSAVSAKTSLQEERQKLNNEQTFLHDKFKAISTLKI